jgi:hypothetical protein
MKRWPMVMALALAVPVLVGAADKAAMMVSDGPQYTADGQLKFPAKYKEWVFLGAGLDMSYNKDAKAADHSMFNSVFVNPEAYHAFLATGTWPEGTEMVLENRGAQRSASINKRGQTMSPELMGLEVHVKDAAHLKGGWGFYSFDNEVSTKLMERPMACYTCHEGHGAVDTTFVQFYPTLLEVATKKGTLSKEYLTEMGGEASK